MLRGLWRSVEVIDLPITIVIDPIATFIFGVSWYP